jgi:hypothetical protein
MSASGMQPGADYQQREEYKLVDVLYIHAQVEFPD